MRDYYEDLWARLPEQLTPPQMDVRGPFLFEQLAPGRRVLDLGCGDGAFSELALAHTPDLRLTAADVADAALARVLARPRLPAGVTVARVPFDGDLPFEDTSFDLVWASEVIEHVADTGHWLSEVRRVLAPGATLALTTPNHSRLRLAIGGIGAYSPPLGDHLHLYDTVSLTELLEEFGFGQIAVRARGRLGRFSELLCATAVR